MLLSTVSFSQFINRDQTKGNEGYSNYAGRNYENYSVQFNKRKIYDNYGNFLVDGLSVYELGESQNEGIGLSNVQKSKYYNLWFNNLLIGNDSYGGFNSRIMLGEAIRTKFTSLTLDKARFNGIRWDGSTNKYRGSIVASRISDPVRIRFDASALQASIAHPRDWPVYMFGAHAETDLGDILTVGATYVNQHQRHNSIDSKTSSTKGDVANTVPRVIFIRVRDDSPSDLSGAIVYNTPLVTINGKEYPLQNINGRVPSDINTNLNNPIQYYVFRNFYLMNDLYLEGAKSVLDPLTGQQIPANKTSFNQYRNEYALTSPPSYPLELKGTSNITYAFVMPFGVQSFSVKLLVANDYVLESAQDWVLRRDEYPTERLNLYPNHYDSTVFARPTPFFTVEQARGNVQDASNKRYVSYTYGLNTGMAVYGMNFQLNWNGFEIEGEFNRSSTFRKYPLLLAGHSELMGNAFFIRGTKKLGRLTFGGERYRIDPTYSTALNIYTLENSYFSKPAGEGLIEYTPPDVPGYYSDDGNKSIPDFLLPGGAYFSLVDDNDDNDRWEDGYYMYNAIPASSTPSVSVPSFPDNKDVINSGLDDESEINPFKLGYRQNTNELSGLTDIIRKPDAGIFPGKDRDRDGIPDDDRNSNGLPDYAEDFMTYYSDPPQFEAGDDWNNNGLIDAQENDILPDYPYAPDVDGYHYFATMEVLKNLTAGVGVIRERGIARGGINNVNYFKSSFYLSAPRFGSLDVYYTLKRVRDNISNDSYVFDGVVKSVPRYERDVRLYRNSLSNTLYIGTKYNQIPNLNIENNVRFELNDQFTVGTPTLDEVRLGQFVDEQFEGVRTSMGLVNKIDYTYSLLSNRLKLRPQFKVRTLKVVTENTFDDNTTATFISTHTQSYIPILRVDYKLTENTELHFGWQGTRLFGLTNVFLMRTRYLRDGALDSDQNTTAVSLTNRSQYSGYNIVIDFGYKVTDKNYIRPIDQQNNSQSAVIYFTIFAGY
jgi:hypothetical protein